MICWVKLFLFGCVMTQANPIHEGEKLLVTLSPDNFSQLFKKKQSETFLLSFVTEICSFCEDAKFTIRKMAYDHRKSDVNFGEINCNDNKDICSKMNISEFSSLMLVNEGRRYIYDGKKSEKSIWNFTSGGFKTSPSFPLFEDISSFSGELSDAFEHSNKESKHYLQYLSLIFKNIFSISTTTLFILALLVLCISAYYLLDKKRTIDKKEREEVYKQGGTKDIEKLDIRKLGTEKER